MRYAMEPHRPKPRVAKQYLQAGARSRVALQHRTNIFANPGEHRLGLSADVTASPGAWAMPVPPAAASQTTRSTDTVLQSWAAQPRLAFRHSQYAPQPSAQPQLPP